MRVLFICKKNETYGFTTYTRKSSGLYNSTRFIVEAMAPRGIHAHIVEVIDNNCIDREVTKFKPDVVVIEALWVVPSKFDVLQRLHPRVKWYCHMHSGIPFVGYEGIAIEWLYQYAWKNVGIIANSVETFEAYKSIFPPAFEDLHYLPNVYLSNPMKPIHKTTDDYINVGCFGAVRPLKNTLLQAMVAIEFAREIKKELRFHINGTRTETGGEPILKNLKTLFAIKAQSDQPAHLIRHHWMEHEDFLRLLRRMDIGMQVSLSETFNVVSADYVTAGVPIVVSKEVAWASCFSKASDSDPKDILKKMHRAWNRRGLIRVNQKLLLANSHKAQNLWYHFLKSHQMGC